MTEQFVLYSTDEKVGIVTMNRPDKLNALSNEMRAQLGEKLLEADNDPTTSVVVLRAEGRAFCTGFDIGGGGGGPTPWKGHAARYHERLTNSMRVIMTPWTMKKPVIASVNGYAMGGGCEMAMFCDLTIAADDAKFGEPEAIFSHGGPGMVMPWIIGLKKARELLYFGDTIDAKTALELQMVNRVVPAAELNTATMKYAKRLSMIAPETLRHMKAAVTRGAEIAGFTEAMNSGLDLLMPLYVIDTEVGIEFDEIRKKDGLKAALNWRRGQLQEK